MASVDALDGPQGKRRRGVRILLDDGVSARKTLARLIVAYARGKLESAKFRDLCYGMSQLLAYFHFERDGRIEERLDRIEETLEKMPGKRGGEIHVEIENPENREAI